MFDRQRYITKGVQSEIPVWVQAFIWQSIESMNVVSKDYLQVFRLERSRLSGSLVQQRIIHSQEQPVYKKEYFFPVSAPVVNARIFVIDDDTHCTMLLAEEY